MSKIGSKVIAVETAKVTLQDRQISLSGPKGTVVLPLPSLMKVTVEGTNISVVRANESKTAREFHGLTRSLIANAVTGVTKGWEKKLEVVGTGFGVSIKGGDAVFKVGFSHQVTFPKIEGLTYTTEGATILVISGADKQLVGEAAFKARKIKPPDAYKGKGIRYVGEVVKLKPGKKAKTA